MPEPVPQTPDMKQQILTKIFEQGIAIILAVGMIGILIGMIPSPLMQGIEKLKSQHVAMLRLMVAHCVNEAGGDKEQVGRCMQSLDALEKVASVEETTKDFLSQHTPKEAPALPVPITP